MKVCRLCSTCAVECRQRSHLFERVRQLVLCVREFVEIAKQVLGATAKLGVVEFAELGLLSHRLDRNLQCVASLLQPTQPGLRICQFRLRSIDFLFARIELRLENLRAHGIDFDEAIVVRIA